jgi:2-oxoisovalerate dehydrogenase E2 component (dihydrolipoyl transacylase)
MGELMDFRLPDVGEGLTEADILRWLVAVGDRVEVNQVLVEIETAKAAVELPSPYAGVVHALRFPEGATVNVGQPFITIATDAPATASPDPAADPAPDRHAVLVGYGASNDRPRRRRRLGPTDAEPRPEPAPANPSPLAPPPVRKLAKTLGVDLAAIQPSGPHGTVSRADVEAAADLAAAPAPDPAPAPSAAPAPAKFVHLDENVGPAWGSNGDERSGGPSNRGQEQRIPVRGVRKLTAAAMTASAFTAPHVTEFVTVDVTASMQLLTRIGGRREFQAVTVSPLLLVARAVLLGLARVPTLNSRWSEQPDGSAEIVIPRRVNLGIAAATERGLLVPNIKEADTLSLLDLAIALRHLTELARSGKTSPADLAGGTFTITNVGVFGVDSGTPILNPGEAGILALGAIRRRPWVVGEGADERIEPRWVGQLALSFDHRSVDGQQGSEFLAHVAALLNDPGLALL